MDFWSAADKRSDLQAWADAWRDRAVNISAAGQGEAGASPEARRAQARARAAALTGMPQAEPLGEA